MRVWQMSLRQCQESEAAARLQFTKNATQPSCCAGMAQMLEVLERPFFPRAG